MAKFVLDPEEELLRGLTPAQVRAIRRLYEGDCDLNAGELARVAAGFREAAKRCDVLAVEKANVKKGKSRLILGALFTHRPAHETDRLQGDAIRKQYPKAKHPELYGVTQHKETVDIKVGTVGG